MILRTVKIIVVETLIPPKLSQPRKLLKVTSIIDAVCNWMFPDINCYSVTATDLLYQSPDILHEQTNLILPLLASWYG